MDKTSLSFTAHIHVKTYALTGSKGLTANVGCVSASLMIFCVSYSKNIPKRTRPPYIATEYSPAPSAVDGGRNADPEVKWSHWKTHKRYSNEKSEASNINEPKEKVFHTNVKCCECYKLIQAFHSPSDDMKTTPSPIAKGPPMFKNFSLGAQIAKVDKPTI